jgi:DNA-binding transcriptional LysR family regulator
MPRDPWVRIELGAIDQLTVTDAQVRGLDVLVALGWPGDVSLVQRRLAQGRLIVCASPTYWERHGIPQRPRDLAGQGVGRFADRSVWPHVRSGELQPVMSDWDSGDAPPFSALYRPGARGDVVVQGFVGLP